MSLSTFADQINLQNGFTVSPRKIKLLRASKWLLIFSSKLHRWKEDSIVEMIAFKNYCDIS